MRSRVTLTILGGPFDGKAFVIEQRSICFIGRGDECHIRLPPGDRASSRLHALCEIDPPEICVCDLGSTNGTSVNGRRITANREQAGGNHRRPQIDLKDGDKIGLGDTRLLVRIDSARCVRCGALIGENNPGHRHFHLNEFVCSACSKKAVESTDPGQRESDSLKCQKCGATMPIEGGANPRSGFICPNCRNRLQDNSADRHDLRGTKSILSDGQAPPIRGYEIKRLIGKGESGNVYLARRRKDSRELAIKFMLPSKAADIMAREHFLREVEITRSLQHNHIVPLRENGSVDGIFYFVMDYCEGGNFKNLMDLRGGRIALPEATKLMLEVLDGLEYLHRNNYVHRDLKPHNLLLAKARGGWCARISDMGLTKNFVMAGLSNLTDIDVYAGTPQFSPREQVINYLYEKPSGDVFSMAATFYYILTGQFPRDFPDGHDALDAVLHNPIVPIRKREPTVPQKLAMLIDQSLSDEPGERFDNGTEMRAAFQKVL